MRSAFKDLKPTCDTAIVMGFTRAWTAPAAVVLQALNDVEPQPFDAILFVQDLTQDQRDRLNRIRTCQFVDYEPRLPDTDRFERVSSMAFSRYECWSLLSSYERVLWIDSDTLPVAEVLSCFELVKETGLGLIPHHGTPMRVSFARDIPGFDMERECFNSGFIALTRAIGDYTMQRDWLNDATSRWSKEVNSDQAVINMMFQALDKPPTALPSRYNCSPQHVVPDVRLLHPWGNQKFWDGLSDPRWDAYLKQWISLGGEPAPTPRVRPQPQALGRLRRGLQAMRRLCPV